MSDARKSAVTHSAGQVLLPLAELLLSARLGVGDFVALAKVAFVQAAIAKTRKAERERPNLSRIAVETGITRQEVAAILKQRKGTPLPFRRGRARAERVLSAWWTDEEFLDRQSRPAPLRLRGPVPSFVTLAQRYGGTGRAQPILDELLRAEAIEKLNDGRYRALRRTCLNIAWDKESVAELGLQLRQLGEALLHNLNHPQEPQFARFFQSGLIDEGHARVLLRDLKAEGEFFLEGASDRLGDKLYAAKPLPDKSEARRFAIGVQVLQLPVNGGRRPTRARRAVQGRRASKPSARGQA